MSNTEIEIGFEGESSPGKSIVTRRTVDVAEYEHAQRSVPHSDIARVVQGFERALGHEASVVRNLSVRDRCQLAEKLLEGDRGGVWYTAGSLNIPPGCVEQLLDAFFVGGDENVDHYQKRTRQTAIYPSETPDSVPPSVLFRTMVVAGAVGDIAEKVKKAWREGDESYLDDLGSFADPSCSIESVPDLDSIPPEVVYCSLGLFGESAEVVSKVRDCWVGGESVDGAIDELGDVGWYWARLADEAGRDSSAVLSDNLDKLFDRQDRGVLEGEGDDR